ncbi:Uncharacterised protein [Dermatophilus congolensis]|uniref:Uncharacterized protein n=1 Tax=Dermatophilus congolensis TaxID=1863 RepID=A0AA46BPV6_9MICO|nr:Uncharacterised protein [Dermatophilus congolensis]
MLGEVVLVVLGVSWGVCALSVMWEGLREARLEGVGFLVGLLLLYEIARSDALRKRLPV